MASVATVVAALVPALLRSLALAFAALCFFVGSPDARADKCTEKQEEAASGKNYKTVNDLKGARLGVSSLRAR
mgnify:CR=1 FL=1